MVLTMDTSSRRRGNRIEDIMLFALHERTTIKRKKEEKKKG
jgi:hypothetical protein